LTQSCGLSFLLDLKLCEQVCLRLLAIGPAHYFVENWNRFDFVIVMATVVAFCLEAAGGTDLINLNIMRSIRGTKAVMLTRSLKRQSSTRQLIVTLMRVIPSIWNVTAVFLLLLFIFALLGMAFFGELEVGKGRYQALDAHANFSNLGMAMLTLFRCITGEGWNAIMMDIQEVYPAAWFYWVSYYLVCVLTMVQLVVGAIVSEFLVTQGAGRKQFIVGTTDIHLFAQEWAALDHTGEYLLSSEVPTGKDEEGLPCKSSLEKLLLAAPPPLGFSEEEWETKHCTDRFYKTQTLGDLRQLVQKENVDVGFECNIAIMSRSEKDLEWERVKTLLIGHFKHQALKNFVQAAKIPHIEYGRVHYVEVFFALLRYRYKVYGIEVDEIRVRDETLNATAETLRKAFQYDIHSFYYHVPLHPTIWSKDSLLTLPDGHALNYSEAMVEIIMPDGEPRILSGIIAVVVACVRIQCAYRRHRSRLHLLNQQGKAPRPKPPGSPILPLLSGGDHFSAAARENDEAESEDATPLNVIVEVPDADQQEPPIGVKGHKKTQFV